MRRVAEIHFEAQYVPPHHSVEEFATALRAAGEPIRGLPVKEISVGRMLESLFSITRDFDMPTQPHLLLLQKSMVMNEGVATALDPDINMWETAEPFLRDWLRGELGPEAYYADRLIELVRAVKLIPDLIKRIDKYYPPFGAAPPPPPLARDHRDRASPLARLRSNRRTGRGSWRGGRSPHGVALLLAPGTGWSSLPRMASSSRPSGDFSCGLHLRSGSQSWPW